MFCLFFIYAEIRFAAQPPGRIGIYKHGACSSGTPHHPVGVIPLDAGLPPSSRSRAGRWAHWGSRCLLQWRSWHGVLSGTLWARAMGRAAVRRLKLGRSVRFAYRAKFWKDRDTGVVVEGRKVTLSLRENTEVDSSSACICFVSPAGVAGLDTR